MGANGVFEMTKYVKFGWVCFMLRYLCIICPYHFSGMIIVTKLNHIILNALLKRKI